MKNVDISSYFLSIEYQRCIVQQVRNTLKYVSYKDRKEFANNLKIILRKITIPVSWANKQKNRVCLLETGAIFTGNFKKYMKIYCNN